MKYMKYIKYTSLTAIHPSSLIHPSSPEFAVNDPTLEALTVNTP